MLSIALTGNIGAGKSEVLRRFRDWGATVIDADQLVREAQQPGTDVLNAIIGRFGREVLLPSGELDRAALRGRVIGDDEALSALNGIVHPAVRKRREQLVAEALGRGDALVVNDIPLLFEAADPGAFDLVVLVDAPTDLRRERLIRHRSLTAQEADRMIEAQIPAARKRERADLIIENGGTLADLDRNARTAWEEIRRRADATA
ncbi:MAG TPA: dephospho-CoA kinase [Gemmatimonadales bacterium]|nr:dephospho-CoA kinase [Gemmatimonadales bacterium]